MKSILIGFTIATLPLATRARSSPPAVPPEAALTVRARDEAGTPVPDAQVTLGFEYNTGSGVATQEIKVPTDADGRATAHGATSGYVTFTVTKPGYYRTIGRPFSPTGREAGRWLPYNPTLEAVLKPVGSPVAMYARQSFETDIPKGTAPVGFDLVEGAWMPPHGQGKQADLLFSVDAQATAWNDYSASLRVSFTNPGDGAIPVQADPKYGSELRLPRTAPETGFSPEIALRRGRVPSTGGDLDQIINTAQGDRSYLLRVRTRQDGADRVVSALYGKISGDFDFDPRESKGAAFLRFTYYLNPTPNDRNLEFDPTRNLSPNLKSTEAVPLP